MNLPGSFVLFSQKSTKYYYYCCFCYYHSFFPMNLPWAIILPAVIIIMAVIMLLCYCYCYLLFSMSLPRITLLTLSPAHDFSRPHHWREQQSWHTDSLHSFPELPSLLLAGVEEGPRRQKWKHFLCLPPCPSLPACQRLRVSYSFILYPLPLSSLMEWLK